MRIAVSYESGQVEIYDDVHCGHHEHHGHCGEDKHGCAGNGGKCGG